MVWSGASTPTEEKVRVLKHTSHTDPCQYSHNSVTEETNNIPQQKRHCPSTARHRCFQMGHKTGWQQVPSRGAAANPAGKEFPWAWLTWDADISIRRELEGKCCQVEGQSRGLGVKSGCSCSPSTRQQSLGKG